jgi:hypothetical protein
MKNLILFAVMMTCSSAFAAPKADLLCEGNDYRLELNYDGMSGINVYQLKGSLQQKRNGRYVNVSDMECSSTPGAIYSCDNTLGADAGYRANLAWSNGGTELTARVFQNVSEVASLSCTWTN